MSPAAANAPALRRTSEPDSGTSDDGGGGGMVLAAPTWLTDISTFPRLVFPRLGMAYALDAEKMTMATVRDRTRAFTSGQRCKKGAQ